MSDITKPAASQATDGASVGSSISNALARRRMLLNSLSKGSTLVVATSIPMKTLAADTTCQTDGKKTGGVHYYATASRCASPIGSRHTTLPVSEGYSCDHYKTSSKWPGYSLTPKNDTSDRNKRMCDIFTTAPLNTISRKTCERIVNENPTSQECRWVVAYQNAKTCAGKNYPYTCADITQLHRGAPGLPTRTACESFFGNHMENMS